MVFSGKIPPTSRRLRRSLPVSITDRIKPQGHLRSADRGLRAMSIQRQSQALRLQQSRHHLDVHVCAMPQVLLLQMLQVRRRRLIKGRKADVDRMAMRFALSLSPSLSVCLCLSLFLSLTRVMFGTICNSLYP